MPTKNPRIVVTLAPEDYELVRKVATAQGSSMSALLREYVEMSRPMLQHMAGLIDAFANADRERVETHQTAIAGAIEKGQALFDLAAGQMPLFLDAVKGLADEIGADPDEAMVALLTMPDGPEPPTCNTGVTCNKCLPDRLSDERKEKGENKNKKGDKR